MENNQPKVEMENQKPKVEIGENLGCVIAIIVVCAALVLIRIFAA